MSAIMGFIGWIIAGLAGVALFAFRLAATSRQRADKAEAALKDTMVVMGAKDGSHKATDAQLNKEVNKWSRKP